HAGHEFTVPWWVISRTESGLFALPHDSGRPINIDDVKLVATGDTLGWVHRTRGPEGADRATLTTTGTDVLENLSGRAEQGLLGGIERLRAVQPTAKNGAQEQDQPSSGDAEGDDRRPGRCARPLHEATDGRAAGQHEQGELPGRQFKT